MIAKAVIKRSVVLSFVVGGILLFQTPLTHAQIETETPTPELTANAIAAIKQRARQILQERQKAKKLQFGGEVTQAFGYEKNPSYNSSHKGSWYSEEDLSLYLIRKLTPTLTWMGSYYGSFQDYFRFTDDTYTYQLLTPVKLIWQPGQVWRADAAIDLEDLWYPDNKVSNYRSVKPSIGLRQNLWGTWFQAVRYQWFDRYYISARARNGAGAETTKHRNDVRHTFRYDLGTTWKETLFKVRNEWYINDSNDKRQDFYDAEDYRVTASVSRPITPKLLLNASYSFERKNYSKRQVPKVTARARYDDIQTYAISGIYKINDTWSLDPSFSYSRDNSNDPTGEYFDWTASVGLTAKF